MIIKAKDHWTGNTGKGQNRYAKCNIRIILPYSHVSKILASACRFQRCQEQKWDLFKPHSKVPRYWTTYNLSRTYTNSADDLKVGTRSYAVFTISFAPVALFCHNFLKQTEAMTKLAAISI